MVQVPDLLAEPALIRKNSISGHWMVIGRTPLGHPCGVHGGEEDGKEEVIAYWRKRRMEVDHA